MRPISKNIIDDQLVLLLLGIHRGCDSLSDRKYQKTCFRSSDWLNKTPEQLQRPGQLCLGWHWQTDVQQLKHKILMILMNPFKLLVLDLDSSTSPSSLVFSLTEKHTTTGRVSAVAADGIIHHFMCMFLKLIYFNYYMPPLHVHDSMFPIFVCPCWSLQSCCITFIYTSAESCF